jgi:tRNA A-37 threonylcarbamoyl transferase component Bud32
MTNQPDSPADPAAPTLPPQLPSETVTQPGAGPAEAPTLPPQNLGDEPHGPRQYIRTFGDYELLAEISRGGMGVVYKARQVGLNRLVALKMILTGQLASAADVQRFRTEAEAAANLDHANILPVYEVGEQDGQHYFSMKVVDGGNLAEKIPALVKDARASAGLLAKVARAVHFAHQRGILHRDLKPANILLDKDGTPYVADFGLAKRTEGDSGMTQSGAIVGTPSYMAPEQARAEKQLTTSADVYALGAILYELLTGRPPFRAATTLDTVMQVIEREPERPRTVNPKADRDLAAITLKCLAKDPAARYASAAALADDLDRWLAGEPTVAKPPSLAGLAGRWLRRNAVAAIGTVALGLLWGMSVGISVTKPLSGRSDLRFWPSDLTGPLGWVKLAKQEPWFGRLVLWLAVLLSVSVGWLVLGVARPKTRRAALGVAASLGLIATLVGFLFAGPLEAVRERRSLHPVEEDYQWTVFLREATGRKDIPAADTEYLKQYLPPEKRSLQYRGWGTDIVVLRSQARTANRLETAYTGVWASTFAALGFFGVLGMISTGVAEGLWRTRGRVRDAIVPYAELYGSSAAILVFVGLWLYLDWTGGIFLTHGTTYDKSLQQSYLFGLLTMAAVLLGLLAVLAYSLVLSGRRWYVRWGAYCAWTAVVAVIVWLSDAVDTARQLARSISI